MDERRMEGPASPLVPPANEGIFASLRLTSFRWLWASGLLSGFGMYSSVLVLSWLALSTQGSTLAVGVLLAARVLPQLLFGLQAGALADRFSRSHLVLAANAGSGAVIGLLCLASVGGAVGLPILAGGAFLVSICDAIRVTAASAMAFDLVGRRSATNAIALSNLAAQVSGIFAGIVGGYGLAALGPTPTLLLAAVAYLAGAVLVPRGVLPAAAKVSGAPVSFGRAAATIIRNRTVALIAIVVAGSELFAFSSMTLLPSFARDVFGIGAAGLGWLLSARAVGGSVGLLANGRLLRTARRSVRCRSHRLRRHAVPGRRPDPGCRHRCRRWGGGCGRAGAAAARCLRGAAGLGDGRLDVLRRAWPGRAHRDRTPRWIPGRSVCTGPQRVRSGRARSDRRCGADRDLVTPPGIRQPRTRLDRVTSLDPPPRATRRRSGYRTEVGPI